MASIEQVKTGWRVAWRQDGVKQHERFATLTEAEDFAAHVVACKNRWPYGWVKGHGFGAVKTGAPTFTDWARRSIESRATANPRTRHDYQRDVDLHITPILGDFPVDQLTPEQVGKWLIAVNGKLSPKRVKDLHGLASSIMADAVDHQLCAVNPFRGRMRGLAAVKQEEMTFLTLGEFGVLLEAIDEVYRPLLLLLAHTGLRWSEATALQVGDVDLLAKRLTVVRAWKRTPENTQILGEPKSRRSRRTVVFSSVVADALIPLLATRRPGEFVFTTLQGHVVRHNNFYGRTWKNAIHAAQRCATHATAVEPCGCPGTLAKRPRIHDLRHSHASWLIGDKVSLPAIQRRLGHESITTTVDRYGHLLPDVDAEISAALERWTMTMSTSPDPVGTPV